MHAWSRRQHICVEIWILGGQSRHRLLNDSFHIHYWYSSAFKFEPSYSMNCFELIQLENEPRKKHRPKTIHSKLLNLIALCLPVAVSFFVAFSAAAMLFSLVFYLAQWKQIHVWYDANGVTTHFVHIWSVNDKWGRQKSNRKREFIQSISSGCDWNSTSDAIHIQTHRNSRAVPIANDFVCENISHLWNKSWKIPRLMQLPLV